MTELSLIPFAFFLYNYSFFSVFHFSGAILFVRIPLTVIPPYVLFNLIIYNATVSPACWVHP
ncbi:hypothetical protein BJ165DRAFT_1426937 [Panaeolus papilionaceus]|nr:hypothetical protein BJ165DRAFT_1509374 [Panaeolus papilionaceus]KAF9058276.1 hypothetical protein BJ165DRAFT_1426937 [Panaeolus papilionaceus]